MRNARCAKATCCDKRQRNETARRAIALSRIAWRAECEISVRDEEIKDKGIKGWVIAMAMKAPEAIS